MNAYEGKAGMVYLQVKLCDPFPLLLDCVSAAVAPATLTSVAIGLSIKKPILLVFLTVSNPFLNEFKLSGCPRR